MFDTILQCPVSLRQTIYQYLRTFAKLVLTSQCVPQNNMPISVSYVFLSMSSNHGNHHQFNLCWYKFGPPSTTLAQTCTSTGCHVLCLLVTSTRGSQEASANLSANYEYAINMFRKSMQSICFAKSIILKVPKTLTPGTLPLYLWSKAQ